MTSPGIDIMKVSQAQLDESAESQSNDDVALNALLVRLASLQNFAVPFHRFAMAATNASGAAVMEMQRSTRAMELWLNAFPSGEAYRLEGQIDREFLPALWISSDGEQVRLIKGAMSQGSFLVEDFAGDTSELSLKQVEDGDVLIMTPMVSSKDHQGHQLKTARDWFFHAIRKRKAVFIESVFATASMSVLALTGSFYTMQVYDRVIPSQGYSTLYVLTAGVLVGLLLELLMKQLRATIVDKGCKAIDQELSGVFFGRVLDIRMDARPKSVGTFAGQIRNFEMVRNFMTSSTLFILADAPFVFFFVFVIFAVAGWLAVIPLAFLPLSIGVGLYAKWKISRYAGEQLDNANKKSGLLIETIDGIEAIKAVGGEWKMLGRWNSITEELSEKELMIRSTTMMAANLTQSMQQICYVMMIAVGAYSVTQGLITQGALIACSIISNRALGPIGQISGIIVQWQHAKEALKGLDQIMALESDRNPDAELIIPDICRGSLSLDAASFNYAEDLVALNSSSIALKPGERVAVIGPVGSGKSTFIKLLSGLYKPTEGRCFLDGVDMVHLAPEFVREHLGYLTQDVRLFHGTLKDNLVMGLPAPTDSQVLDAATITGLHLLIKTHPKGLALPITEGGRGLSGGQRQLVGLTRLLIAKPKILLLDEPTASMDNELEAHVMRGIFANMGHESSIVLATHKMGLLNLVDRIIVMSQGKVVADGPRDQILQKMFAKKTTKSNMDDLSSPKELET